MHTLVLQLQRSRNTDGLVIDQVQDLAACAPQLVHHLSPCAEGMAFNLYRSNVREEALRIHDWGMGGRLLLGGWAFALTLLDKSLDHGTAILDNPLQEH